MRLIFGITVALSANCAAVLAADQLSLGNIRLGYSEAEALSAVAGAGRINEVEDPILPHREVIVGKDDCARWHYWSHNKGAQGDDCRSIRAILDYSATVSMVVRQESLVNPIDLTAFEEVVRRISALPPSLGRASS